jgi:hypothetical protein
MPENEEEIPIPFSLNPVWFYNILGNDDGERNRRKGYGPG